MPKPAVHYCNSMADFDPKFLIKLTYHEFVFYSEKKNKFVVNRNLTELKDFM
jgi:hypothetical protein